LDTAVKAIYKLVVLDPSISMYRNNATKIVYTFENVVINTICVRKLLCQVFATNIA